jgi:branched-chain amino acid transport system substrate-binding protein
VRRPSLVIAAAVTAICLAAGISACGDGGGGGEKSFDLTIGDSVPLTGDLADFGPPGDKAAKLAVSQINAAIKKDNLDQTVKLVTQDNETNPQAAVSAARKMVADGASCIMGAWASADTIPTARSVSIPEGVLQISPASTSDEITGLSDDGLLNRDVPPDRYQGPTLANAIDEAIGGAKGKTVNIGARNDSYGTGLADTFSAAWEAKGGKIGEKVIYDTEQPTYNSEAQKIVSGNPDVVVIIDFPQPFDKVAPALARTGNWDPSKTWATDGLASSDVPSGAGASTVAGMRGTAPGSPDKGKTSAAFDKLYTSAAPKDVGRQTFDAQQFDAGILCYLSAVAAGSTDGKDMADEVRDVSAPPGTKYTFEQLPEAIKALQDGDDIDYQGASGAIDMNDEGDGTAGVYDIYKYTGAPSYEIIGELPVAQPTEGG